MMPKILLVEDEPQIADIYGLSLKKSGFAVEIMKYGVQAKERLKAVREGEEHSPDLIILDLILPDMNGIDVLEEMKKYPETKDIPCFIVTNYSDINLERRSLALHADKFILKTACTPKELTEIVKERLAR